jgi:mannose-6-phosphate isomerase-like protein (cupin superfamily)
VLVGEREIDRRIDLAMSNVYLPKIQGMLGDGSQLRIYDKDGNQKIITRDYTKSLFSELRKALLKKEDQLITRSNSAEIDQEISEVWMKFKNDCRYQATIDVVSYLASDVYSVTNQKNGGRLIEHINLSADGQPVSKFEYVAHKGKAFRGNVPNSGKELIMRSQEGGQLFKYSPPGVDGKPETMMFEYAAASRRTVGKNNLIISMENAKLSQANTVDYPAPDTTEIRLLPAMDGASFCHCTIGKDVASLAGSHGKIEEVWYYLGGEKLNIWRDGGTYNNEVTVVSPGDSIEIPPGVKFQARNEGAKPAYLLIATMPPWPGDEEWNQCTPHWEPTAKSPRPNP